MATQYEDPCVLWIRLKDRKLWIRYLNCRSQQIAGTQAEKLCFADSHYKMGETVKILLPGQEP